MHVHALNFHLRAGCEAIDSPRMIQQATLTGAFLWNCFDRLANQRRRSC